ncbi:mucin-5AC-like [Mya arenaria]|uniref:mucin-5AC-like n=1 Tax=Mya arenaria TaxID=6604 RepID=UPI0022E03B25|nr:mucin-5AC-like [Mya arenaria]
MRLFSLLVCVQFVSMCRAFTTMPTMNVWGMGNGNQFMPWGQYDFLAPALPNLTPSPVVTTKEPLTPVSSAAPVVYETKAPKPQDFSDRLQALLMQTADIAKHPNANVTNLTKTIVSVLLAGKRKQETVTAQTPLVTTTEAVTTTPATTSTTTATTTTTALPVTTTTKKPLLEMTLAELLMAASKGKSTNIAAALLKHSKPKNKRRGCMFQGKMYMPLTEIERGQSGSWCFGSYCNHESDIVHWDDHNCTSATKTPKPLMGVETAATTFITNPPTKPTTPATTTSVISGMDPVLLDQLYRQFLAESTGTGSATASSSSQNINSQGVPDQMTALLMQQIGSGASVTSGASLNAPIGAHGNVDPVVMAMMQQAVKGSPGLSGSSGAGIGARPSTDGCVHQGRWHAPGTDIESHRDYGHCYGFYCDFNSQVKYWSDRCAQTEAPPTQNFQELRRQLQQLDLLKK